MIEMYRAKCIFNDEDACARIFTVNLYLPRTIIGRRRAWL